MTFGTHVNQQEGGGDPCHFVLDRLSCHSFLFSITPALLFVRGARLLPKSRGAHCKLCNHEAGHEVKELPPAKPVLYDHCSSYRGADGGTRAVACMQQSQDLMWMFHYTNPCIPAGVQQAIPKAGEGE